MGTKINEQNKQIEDIKIPRISPLVLKLIFYILSAEKTTNSTNYSIVKEIIVLKNIPFNIKL